MCQVCESESEDFASFCSNCGSSLFSPSATFSSGQTLVKPVLGSNDPSLVYMPLRAAPSGVCFYHQNLPAAYICSRCGRPICRNCAKPYLGLVLCTPCFTRIVRV
ncbi:MAG: B-box zinc finger protein [Candidatus Bathyarchaeia archaeon]